MCVVPIFYSKCKALSCESLQLLSWTHSAPGIRRNFLTYITPILWFVLKKKKYSVLTEKNAEKLDFKKKELLFKGWKLYYLSKWQKLITWFRLGTIFSYFLLELYRNTKSVYQGRTKKRATPTPRYFCSWDFPMFCCFIWGWFKECCQGMHGLSCLSFHLKGARSIQ